MTKPRRSLESAGISDAQYLQIMERVAEQNYKDWGLPSSDAALIQALNDNTYNYRGYYNKYPNGKGNAVDHWTDEFKTVYHPTFSKESKYSGKKSQYNPKGLTGGTWYGEYFLPSVDLLIERNKYKKGGRSTSYITTGGAGYVPPAIDVSKTKQSINKRLYRTISPLEADYSLLPALQSFLSNKEHDDTRDGVNEVYPVGTIDAIWAKYLQVPEKDKKYSDKLEKSSYRPSKGNNSDNYYKLPLQDYEKESLVNTTRELPLYKNKVSKLLNNYALGEHTVGRGYDNRGEYVSYFDVFDINPFNGKYRGINIPIVNKLDDIGIGKPVRIYDRIYLDDYYGVKGPTHATYIPEVVITGNRKKHKDGGIYIKPSKRGTFTAAATKHGMGVQEFASKVLRNKEDYSPSLVKKANFARNASKWH